MVNRMLKKGDKVVMHTCGEADKYKDKVWTVRSDESEICGSKVVWLEGYQGCFAAEFLRKVGE